jgi:hypothetical protein
MPRCHRPRLPLPPTPTLDDNIEDDDAPDAIPSGLSLASRRRIHNGLYMRRKRAEASGGGAKLDLRAAQAWPQSEHDKQVQEVARRLTSGLRAAIVAI